MATEIDNSIITVMEKTGEQVRRLKKHELIALAQEEEVSLLSG